MSDALIYGVSAGAIVVVGGLIYVFALRNVKHEETQVSWNKPQPKNDSNSEEEPNYGRDPNNGPIDGDNYNSGDDTNFGDDDFTGGRKGRKTLIKNRKNRNNKNSKKINKKRGSSRGNKTKILKYR
jgi:hypothetical protein